MKKKRKSKNELKKELFRSLVEDEEYENDALNNKTDNGKTYQDTIPIIKEYETITQRPNSNIESLIKVRMQILKSQKVFGFAEKVRNNSIDYKFQNEFCKTFR